MIKQQVALTKTFDESVRRITVLTRAAEILWSHEQTKARATFSEAFELASDIEKENEQKDSRSLILLLRVPDQRYVVILAIARKDAGWAKELSQQMLKPDSDRQTASSRRSVENVLITERLLGSAIKLLPANLNAALELANISLRYPASFSLTRFLYKLAEINQQLADQFYAQALNVYREKPMREFLYLQAYPFGWRDTLNTPIFSFYQVPHNLVINQSLQRQFVEMMLRRAQQALNTPEDPDDSYQRPDAELMPPRVHLLEGLIRLEPQVRESLPHLLPQLIQAREKILVSLSLETQKLFLQPGREISTKQDETFDEKMESAQKDADINDRNEAIANAVMSETAEKEDLEHVIEAVEKISDSNLRSALLERLYFQRAASAINEKQFDLAERVASKVEGQEQRAYLHLDLAKALLKKSDSQVHAREVLDDAITDAGKAGITIFAARAFLTASSLYAEIDLNRSVSLLSEAINVVNRLKAPDFGSDDQALEKQLPRNPVRNRGHFLFRYYMPGLNPESAFREMGKRDFDTAFAQANALTDKFQRALSTLALAEVCLQQAEERPAEKSKKLP